MGSLGSLVLSLAVETRQFVGDLGKAAQQANRQAKAIQRTLSTVTLGAGGLFAGNIGKKLTNYIADTAALANESLKAGKSIAEVRKELGALGNLSEESIRSVAALDETIKQLKGSFASLGATIIAKTAPALKFVADYMRITLGGATELEEVIGRLARARAASQGLAAGAGGFANIGDGKQYTKEELERLIAELERKRQQLETASAGGKRAADPKSRGAAYGRSDMAVSLADADRARAEAARAAAQATRDAWAATLDDIRARWEPVIAAEERYRELAQDVADTASDTIDTNWQTALETIKAGGEKAADTLKANLDDMTVFAEQAARNMQDALAQFLFDPFKDGLKGMLKGFIDTMRRMVAEAAAAQIFKLIGQGLSKSGNGFLSGLGSIFGGARAGGGPVTAGRSYLVGERGPELFTPKASGSISPNGAGGGISFSPQYTFNIDSRTDRAEMIAMLRSWGDQVSARTKADLLDAFDREGYGHPRRA